MGYYEEKKRYEQSQPIQPEQVNKCQKCKKGILVTTIRQHGLALRKTTFKSFCPVCGHTIKREI